MQDILESEYAKDGLTVKKLHIILDRILLLRRFEEKIEELFLVKGALIMQPYLYLDRKRSQSEQRRLLRQGI
jgi:hypothetical protein